LVPCATALSALHTLRLGLSSIRTLAVALPQLTVLDANGCSALSHLDLRCPLLLNAFFQACRSVRSSHIFAALHDCQQLELLDAQHLETDAEAMGELRRKCPSLRCLMYSNAV
jgi:hypothetical protein